MKNEQLDPGTFGSSKAAKVLARILSEKPKAFRKKVLRLLNRVDELIYFLLYSNGGTKERAFFLSLLKREVEERAEKICKEEPDCLSYVKNVIHTKMVGHTKLYQERRREEIKKKRKEDREREEIKENENKKTLNSGQ